MNDRTVRRPMFNPMLAGVVDPATLRFPVLASPKLDGIRCLAMGGNPMSRSMAVLPSKHIQAFFAQHAEILEGLDGEIVVGSPTAKDVYRTTVSHVMAHDKVFDFTFVVFDRWARSGSYAEAYDYLLTQRYAFPSNVQLLYQAQLDTIEALESYEEHMLGAGYEGVMLRDAGTNYKQGRSSTLEGILLKVKRYEDAEAVIIGTKEEMFNGNVAEKNELGRTKRSTAQAGLVGKGTMGALVVRGLNGPFKDVEFDIGTGFTAADRAALWVPGEVVTYKFFNVGTKDKPRHTVFKARRPGFDMGAA